MKTANGAAPRILYLRVPALGDALTLRVRGVLAENEGALPVSLFAADTKIYHKQEKGISCTARTLKILTDLLGAENVVLK